MLIHNAVITGSLVLPSSLPVTGSLLISGSVTATAFIPSGATIPTNGMYLSAANTLDLSTNSTNRLSISSTGAATFSSNVTANGNLLVQNGNTLSVYRTDNTRALQLYTTNNECIVESWQATSEPLHIRSFGSSGRIQFFTNAEERMRITSGGNVGIGTSDITAGKLYVIGYGTANSLMTQPVLIASSGANAVQLGSDGTNGLIGVGNSGTSLILLSRASGEYTQAIVIASNNTVKINNLGSGAVSATAGVLSTTSDMNLKVEDGFIDNALEKVLNLKPKYFYWKKESGLPTDLRQLGFYAQEVNEALGEEAANTPKGENDKWGIYDRGMIAMLTKAIQEQQIQIQSLQEQINILSK